MKENKKDDNSFVIALNPVYQSLVIADSWLVNEVGIQYIACI